MKAITDEQVVALMRDLKTREEKARERLTHQMGADQLIPAHSARLYEFEAPQNGPANVRRALGEVVSIAASRAAQNARKTKRGIFIYATDAPQPA